MVLRQDSWIWHRGVTAEAGKALAAVGTQSDTGGQADEAVLYVYDELVTEDVHNFDLCTDDRQQMDRLHLRPV